MVDLTPDQILIPDEMRQPRTADQLKAWTGNRMEQFSKTTELKHYFRLRKGMCRALCQEIIPLGVVLRRLYGSRSDVFGVPSVGDQPFDARILDESTTPTTETFVQITYAIDGHDESIRMEVLNSTGGVAIASPMHHSGTKRSGRSVEVPLEMVSVDSIATEAARLIVRAIRHKRSKTYPAGYILIVGVDDMLVGDSERAKLVEREVRKVIKGKGSEFARTFVAGAKDQLFFEL